MWSRFSTCTHHSDLAIQVILPERNAVRVRSDEIAPTKPSSRIGVAGPLIAGTIQILVRWPFGNCIGSRPSSMKSRSSLRTALPSNIWISPEKRPPLKQVHASRRLNCDGQRTPHTLIRIRSERQSFRHSNLRLQSRSGDLRLCQVTEVVEVPAWRRSSCDCRSFSCRRQHAPEHSAPVGIVLSP